jgi:hypothetical protein
MMFNAQSTPFFSFISSCFGRWGLVPSFTKPGSQLDFYKMFNARSESVAEKPVFSRLLSSHRCVVLLEGFYEWKTDAGVWRCPAQLQQHSGTVTSSPLLPISPPSSKWRGVLPSCSTNPVPNQCGTSPPLLDMEVSCSAALIRNVQKSS